MGWRERDYHRESDEYDSHGGVRFPFLKRRYTIVTTLLAVNIALFIICTLGGGPMGPPGSGLFQALSLYTPAVLRGQIWLLITANYLHVDLYHILFNMLGLYFFGRWLERDWGPKRFFAVYTTAGLAGSLFFLVLSVVGWLPPTGRVAGASGCVLGLVGASAVRYPRVELAFFPLPFSITVKTFALVFGGWYVLNLISKGQNAGGDACHLAGMLFGAGWAWRGEAWWNGLPKSWIPKMRRPRARVVKRQAHHDPTSPFFVSQRKVDEETLDRILKKVGDRGLHSLSETEKQTLLEATEERRKRS